MTAKHLSPSVVLAFFMVACASRVEPGDAADARADSVSDANDITPIDAPDAGPCGDVGFCRSGEICILGRCAGCCDVPPSCVPIPSGCTGALGCGCFTTDPCGGCTTCQSVDLQGIHCGNCMCACAAPWTPIDTPTGPRPIVDLREGDFVYSLDHGRIVPVPIARTVRTPVSHHAVVRIVLSNGSTLEISGRHPTGDGRTLNALQPGDRLGDIGVVSIETVPYDEPFTYDILPVSDTGTYFVSGALIGSTMR